MVLLYQCFVAPTKCTHKSIGAAINGPHNRTLKLMAKWPTVLQAEIQTIIICAMITLHWCTKATVTLGK